MQASSHDPTPSIALGKRRGVLDLACFALNLTRPRADSGSAALSEGYPSPPMSGSPPPPPRSSQEATAGSQGTYQATTQDVYRGIPTRGDARFQAALLPPVSAPTGYALQRSDPSMPRPLSYPTYHGQMMSQYSYLPVLGSGAAIMAEPGPALPAYAASPLHTGRDVGPTGDIVLPSKSQRKPKGHVASACVPCKRAHLRCDFQKRQIGELGGRRGQSVRHQLWPMTDAQKALKPCKTWLGQDAQRPCSRCTSNNKADACVDVQHKKRGRPRLREDQSRYDASRLGVPPELPFTRPLSTYETVPPMAEPLPPRFLDRGSASDTGIFSLPSSVSTARAPEPVAFLTTEMEIARASSTLTDAIGRPSIKGLKLTELLAPVDIERASSYRRELQEEQKQRDPNYLPPIFSKQEADRVIQSLGFNREDLSQYALDRQEYLGFVGQDGQTRNFPVRLGLAKQESIYFVVMVLQVAVESFQHPSPPPKPREMYSYHPMRKQYSQLTPVSATFETKQARLGEPSRATREAAAPGPPPQMVSGSSAGLSPYTASSARVDYPAGASYQVPRSELPPLTRGAKPPSMQLPPIRSQQPGVPPPSQQDPPYPEPGDRYRLGIGGLLDRPESSRRRH